MLHLKLKHTLNTHTFLVFGFSKFCNMYYLYFIYFICLCSPKKLCVFFSYDVKIKKNIKVFYLDLICHKIIDLQICTKQFTRHKRVPMQDYYAQCPCEAGLKCKGTQEDMYWFCRAWMKQYVWFIIEIMLIGCFKIGRSHLNCVQSWTWIV